jgi:hypothetical protein
MLLNISSFCTTHKSSVSTGFTEQNYPVMTAGPCYIASARTAQKSPLPTIIPSLRVTQPLPSNGRFYGSTVLALSKHDAIPFSLGKLTMYVKNFNIEKTVEPIAKLDPYFSKVVGDKDSLVRSLW